MGLSGSEGSVIPGSEIIDVGLPLIIVRHQLFHRRKILPVVLLSGLILTIPIAAWLLVHHITALADMPLASLDTELILQLDSGNKDPAKVQTRGLVEPFNLRAFSKAATRQTLQAIPGVAQTSSALMLWQFDPKNTLTVIGLDVNDPPVGMRKIQQLLMPKSHFFSRNQAREVILERHFAKLFGHKRGGFFQLAGKPLKIIGLVDFTEQSNLSNAAAFLPYQTALDLSHQHDKVINQVFVSLAPAAKLKTVAASISAALPGFALINRNSLYKNLSAFNRLITSGGQFLIWLVTPLSLLLLSWVLKMHRLEFADEHLTLRTMGWPQQDLRRWHAFDMLYLLIGGALVALLLSMMIQWILLPYLHIAPLLDQGLKL